jgi:hypothetical protein
LLDESAITCVIGALLGKRRGGSHLMLAANPTGLRRSERNGPCTAVDFVKGNIKRPASAGRFLSVGGSQDTRVMARQVSAEGT